MRKIIQGRSNSLKLGIYNDFKLVKELYQLYQDTKHNPKNFGHIGFITKMGQLLEEVFTIETEWMAITPEWEAFESEYLKGAIKKINTPIGQPKKKKKRSFDLDNMRSLDDNYLSESPKRKKEADADNEEIDPEELKEL